MAYNDRRRTTAADIVEQVHRGARPIVFLREENSRLVETRKVTSLLRCEVVGVRNLGDRRGYVLSVVLPDGSQRAWGEWSLYGKTLGIQGGTTVWIRHPKEPS